MTFDVQIQEWVEVALAVHALASVIVAATPTPIKIKATSEGTSDIIILVGS